jgi:hypothetical protein
MPRYLGNISLERNGGTGLELEQANYFSPRFRIDTVFLEIPVAVFGRQVRYFMKDLLHTSFHAANLFASSASHICEGEELPLSACYQLTSRRGYSMLKTMRRHLIASLLLVLGAQAIWSQRLIGVYVESGADGFTAAGGGDSSLDLIKSLRGKNKTLQVVDSAANADVIVRITSRDSRKEVGSITTYGNKSDDGKKSTKTTVANENTIRMVRATLTAGSFETDLEGQGSFWRLAADNLAGQVDRWVKQNYARLVEKRSGANGDTPQLQTAPAPAKTEANASIEPGMSPAQVTGLMGEPLKKVTFGQKALWTYKGMQVVFEKDKVTDVKF